jgi:hypothetical protein
MRKSDVAVQGTPSATGSPTRSMPRPSSAKSAGSDGLFSPSKWRQGDGDSAIVHLGKHQSEPGNSRSSFNTHVEYFDEAGLKQFLTFRSKEHNGTQMKGMKERIRIY